MFKFSALYQIWKKYIKKLNDWDLSLIQLCTLIYWLNAKSSTSSEKKIAGRFRLPSQPNGAMQNYSILRPGYGMVRFLDTKCTFGIIRTYYH